MLRFACLLLLLCWPLPGEAVRFAEHGTLKMLCDSRMDPQATEAGGKVNVAWHGDLGLPWTRSYDLEIRGFSEPRMLLAGIGIETDARRFEGGQHCSPVVWKESVGCLHVAFGFHQSAG